MDTLNTHTPIRSGFREDHEVFRAQVRRFVSEHIAPFLDQWEEDGITPKSLWREAGRNGLLCCTIPEEYGGPGGDFGHSVVVLEETTRANASGVGFPLHSDVVAPYILVYGTEAQKQHWLPRMVSGDVIGAIAMTEPGSGSDLKALRTTAVRDGDHYVINGQKTFITNGINADMVIIAAKTDPSLGSRGISLFCIDVEAAGFSKGRKLKKLGMLAQDTGELFFENMRVPADALLGEENQGYSYLMKELARERLVIALRSATSMETMLDETIKYTSERKAFGSAVIDFQNTKFKLADAKAESTMFRVFADHCLALYLNKQLTPDMAAMCKLTGTEMQFRILDSLLQLHGGYGYMREYPIARAWADARVTRIYGGSSEIMREIISRTLVRDSSRN